MGIIDDLRDEAKKISDQLGIASTGEYPGQNDEIDAFRHAYISAITTRKYGKTLTEMGGDAVEIGGDLFKNQKQSIRNMDEHNNAVGRAIGQVAESDEEAAQLVLKALRNGQLQTKPIPIPILKPGTEGAEQEESIFNEMTISKIMQKLQNINFEEYFKDTSLPERRP